MFNNVGKIKNIDIPENLFSNLGEIKATSKPQDITPVEPILNFDKQYNDDKEEISNDFNSTKLTNLSNKNEYRQRIDDMYQEIKDLEPVDNEINSTLTSNNYIEKGIVVKPKVSSIKQFWTEYRLINNEKNSQKQSNTTLSNFDSLFEQLSNRVEEINKYIDELKEMRTNIDESTIKLEEEKNKLEEDKANFMTFKQEEEEKIAQEKENLRHNYDRLQNIIDDLDRKLTTIND